jgi:hypothetical protein
MFSFLSFVDCTMFRVFMARYVARVGETRNARKKIVRRSVGNRPLERYGSGWENNIEMSLKKIGFNDVYCALLARHTV